MRQSSFDFRIQTECLCCPPDGQGNFETLSDNPAELFFLFMTKCPVVAEHVGTTRGSHVLVRARDL